MKVCIITPEYLPSGSGIAVACNKLANSLKMKGIHVDIMSQEDSIADIRVRNRRGLSGILGLVNLWNQALKYLPHIQDNYDLIWMHDLYFINAKALRKIQKAIITIHTTYYGFYQAYKSHAIYRLLPYYFMTAKLEHKCFKELSFIPNLVITAVSPSVAEEAHRNGLTFHPHVIPNGLEINNITLDKYQARTILQKKYSVELSENDQALLYVGRITEQKQPLLLLEFFKVLNSIRPNVHLVVVGSGNLFSIIRKKAMHQHNIHFLGHVPHSELVYPFCAADAFVSLSCYEGLPLSVVEATTFNLPLILSDIPPHRWIINSGIGHGVLVDSRNPSLKKVLQFLNNSEKERDISNTYLEKQFSWENITEQYLSLIKDL